MFFFKQLGDNMCKASSLAFATCYVRCFEQKVSQTCSYPPKKCHGHESSHGRIRIKKILTTKTSKDFTAGYRSGWIQTLQSSTYPKCSMYESFPLGETWPHSRGNVGKYSLHGSYGCHLNSWPALQIVKTSWANIFNTSMASHN